MAFALITRRAPLAARSPFVCSSCLNKAPFRAQSTVATTTTDTAPSSNGPIQARSTKNIIPPPTPWVPDVQTFLKLIGREMSNHASKFTSWDEMFTLNSAQLRSRGLEPTRNRRYFLRWREKFQRSEWGIGGDLEHVKDGVAELRVCDVPALPRQAGLQPEGAGEAFASTTHTPGLTRLIVNVPNGKETYALKQGQKTVDLKKPMGFKLKEGHIITAKYAKPLAGSNGMGVTLTVQEGMWEDKRGRKRNGGERRRAETLHKARVAEIRKNSR